MANTTDPVAERIHGTDPQYLIEKITRLKIHDNPYWKEHCFALTAESLVDKAIELEYVGGTFGGNRRPTKFMCLLLKCLQIQPSKDIIVEFILNDDYKYVRVLGAFYLRLVGKPVEIYQYLEILLNDFRKIRYKNQDGKYEIKRLDELIDAMLTEDYYFDIVLPRLPKRSVLENLGKLDERTTALDLLAEAKDNEDEDEDASSSEDSEDSDSEDDRKSKKSRKKASQKSSKTKARSKSRSRSRSGSYERDLRTHHDRRRRHRSRSRSRSSDRRRRRKDRSRKKKKDRRRSRSRERRKRKRSPSSSPRRRSRSRGRR